MNPTVALTNPDPRWLYGSYGYAVMATPALLALAVAATVALSTRPVECCMAWIIAPYRPLPPRRG